jgi:hypothetical protein
VAGAVDYATAMRLPSSVLLFLYEVQQSVELERRAAATDDGAWSVIGANSKEGHEQLRKRLAVLEAAAAGKAPTNPENVERIEL